MAVRYFARINKRQVGPMTMTELLNAGIRPDTYVWCKGMADWQRASEIPDICRAMRRALSGFDPETGEPRDVEPTEQQDVEPSKFDPSRPPRNRAEMAEFLRQAIEEAEANARPDYTIPPQGVSMFMAVLATILCFPLTGLVAIWFAYKCRSDWTKSRQEGIRASEREELQRSAHDNARLYRMMIGITFCLGIIMVGMALSRTLLN